MKKFAVVIIVTLSLAAVSLYTVGKEEKKDPLENLCTVEKIEPAPQKVKTGFDSITTADAKAYLGFLASDLLEGRDTATSAYNIAAEFAAALFRVWGVAPGGDLLGSSAGKNKRSYFQVVRLREIKEQGSAITISLRRGASNKTITFSKNEDYWYRPDAAGTLSAPLVFVGYGISEKSIAFDEYKGIDVKGKVLIMLDDVPQQDKEDSPFKKGKLREKYDWRNRRSPKTKLAQSKGAAAVLLVQEGRRSRGSRPVNDERPIIPWEKRRRFTLVGAPAPSYRSGPPVIYISTDMAQAILEMWGESLQDLQAQIDRDFKPRSRPLAGMSIKVEDKVETESAFCRNVLGLVEGSDPELKKEVVIIGAHLDHFGKLGDYIFNGADDNGSGSVGVLELAQAFAENPVKPKRSLLFALWTGEEKGGLGSRTYVHQPTFPLEKTAAYLNLDMISRTWDKKNLQRRSRYMGINLTEEALDKIELKKLITAALPVKAGKLLDIVKKSNLPVGMSIFLKEDDSPGGSDHAIFAGKNVPWLFFFAGFSDEFHTPGDSVDKVNFAMLRDVTRLTYLAAFALADAAAQ